MLNYKYVFDVYTIKDMYHNIMPQQFKTAVRNELRSMPQNQGQINDLGPMLFTTDYWFL